MTRNYYLGMKMRKYTKILLLLTFFSFLSTSLTANDTIRISNGEWPPFLSKDLKKYGVTSHVVQEAFALENIEVTYEWYPWKRALHLAGIGELNASIGWSKTKDREKDFLFSDVILNGDVVFFHLKEQKFDWNDFNDLKNIRVGSILDYKYDNKIAEIKQIKNTDIFEVIDEKKLFQMLLKGRFHAVIINLDVGYGILNKYFSAKEMAEITYHKKVFHNEKSRLLFSKKIKDNKVLMEKFNKGLQRLKSNGKFEEYYKNSRNGEYEINK